MIINMFMIQYKKGRQKMSPVFKNKSINVRIL